MHKPIVIALSGASGCGKTTIIKKLAHHFQCPYLLFDDYIDENSYPNNMEIWFNQGANVSLIKTPQFVEAIALIKSSNTEAKYIFIEEPFGRERDSLAYLIDRVILLDIPLEICLNRVISRNNQGFQISNYVEKYERYFKSIYAHCVDQVSKHCDHIFNEVITAPETAIKISQWLEPQEN